MEALFRLPVRTLPAMGDSAIPDRARRHSTETGRQQFLTTFILDRLLQPQFDTA